MKKVYTYLLLFVATASFAQLSVKPSTNTDNYMYVKGTVLYVNEDIALSENTDTDIASIYLRNEAQIVQGRTDASQNSGNGIISVYQEGTTDAYAYNYWGSPVSSSSSSTTGNLQFSVASLGAPTSALLSNDVNMINGYTGSTSDGGILNISKYWIWKYASSNGAYANWIHVEDAQDIQAGEGFTMKGVNGTDNTLINGVPNNSGENQRYDFRGRPNDGLITVNVGGVSDVILVGNPYPSALDLDYFLLENSGSGNVDNTCTGGETVTRRNATTGIAYFWASDPSVNSHNIADYVGGYASYSPNGNCSSIGVYTPPTFYNYTVNGEAVDGSGTVQSVDNKQYRRYLPIGQGFYVYAPESGTVQNIQFKNSHREYMEEAVSNQSVFGRNATAANQPNSTSTSEENLIPKIRFNIAFDDDYTRQIALAFDQQATAGVDVARDALNFDQIASDAGFLLNAKNYVIDIRPFDIEDRLPLYLNLSSQKDIAFNINNFENFDTENVYIYDKDTGEYHPIKDNYFYITLPAGNYSERFEITFQNDEDNLAVADEIAESFTVFQDNKLAQLQILNPKGIDLKNVSVFDMSGKQVINNINLGANNRYTFSTSNLAEAVYIVRIVTTDNVVTTKKISILNRG